jgi:hydroxymethylbilane synthase
LKIGTRGSKLALAQAYETRDKLIAAHAMSGDDIEIIVIKTTGDKIQDRALSEIGGKGLFTKEIEEALYDKSIDLAVHSMKDMPAVLPDGLVMAGLLKREDPRDAFISNVASRLQDLPQGAKLGSSSVRRVAQIRAIRPDLEVVEFRGNVQTRMEKLKNGVADATFLACAGLNRLGEANLITRAMEISEMLPAVAQGAIGIEIRQGDDVTANLLKPLRHEKTEITVDAERGFLIELDGSCRTPLAAHATLDGDTVNLTAMAMTRDGSERFETTRSGPAKEAKALGRDAGIEIARLAGDKLFA